jgi:hypothetical protein
MVVAMVVVVVGRMEVWIKKLKINPPPSKLFNNKVSFHFPSNSALRRRRTRKKNMIHKMIFIPLFIDSKIGKTQTKPKKKTNNSF